MTRSELFERASTSIADLARHYPGDGAINSITIQLNYLKDIDCGKRTDRERLHDIIIGVLTVREIEPLSEDVANLLYEVVEQVELMKSESSR